MTTNIKPERRLRCSREQKTVSQALRHGHVVVNSNPGSGKTTCALFISRAHPDARILLITYSAHLKSETREKLRSHDVKNIDAESYHSFFYHHYDPGCTTDIELEDALERRAVKPFAYDIIIVDECQDMTFLYYRAIRKILNDNQARDRRKVRLCMLGDRRQNIYRFKQSDERFLTLAPKLFTDVGVNAWRHVQLQTSYRLTQQIADFINHVLFRGTREFPIIAPRQGEKPVYYKLNTRSRDLFDVIDQLLDTYNPEDIFILAPSLRSRKSPVRELENAIKLMRTRTPVFIPSNDDESLSEGVMKHKLVFATYHQSKGRERPVTVVLNFDESYFHSKNNDNRDECPNEINVACSRSTEKLILVQDCGQKPLPFLGWEAMQRGIVDFYEFCKPGDGLINNPVSHAPPTPASSSTSTTRPYPVTDFCRFASNECIRFMLENITITRVDNDKVNDDDNHHPVSTVHRRCENEETPSLKAMIIHPKPINSFKTFDYHGVEVEEDLSALIGTAIPMIYEFEHFGKSKVYSLLRSKYLLNPDRNLKLPRLPEQLSEWGYKHWFMLANLWHYDLSKYYFKLYQINNYSFVRKESRYFKSCVTRLHSLGLSNRLSFEEPVWISNMPDLPGITLRGSIDCIDFENQNAWEFKCVDTIGHQHILQVCVYMYLLSQRCPVQEFRWFIFNIKKGECVQIRADRPILKKIVSRIYNEKWLDKPAPPPLDDDLFVARALSA